MNNHDPSINIAARDALNTNSEHYHRLREIEYAHLEEKGEGYESWFGAVGESMIYETIVGDVARWMTYAWMDNDPDFSVTPTMLERVASDIPDNHESLMNAKSRAELDARIMNIREINQHRELLSHTTGGTAAMVVGGLLDPTYLTAGLLTGGQAFLGVGMKAGQGIKNISRMSRLQGFTRAGLIAGLEVGALESARAGLSDTWDLEDAAIATAMGIGVGGLIGARWPQITVPRKVADETTERLYRQRFNALAETTEISIEEAQDLAMTYAKNAGRMGYGKFGQKVYHKDPTDIAQNMIVRDINREVAQGTIRKTTLGQQVIPEDQPTLATPEQYRERISSLRAQAEGLIDNTKNALDANSTRVANLDGKTARLEAQEAGISLEGPRGGKKTTKKIKEDLRRAQEQTIRAAEQSEAAKINKALEETKVEWARADGIRDAAHNFEELTGESIDDILKRTPTYDPAKDERDLVQKAVDWVDSKWWLFGTTAGQLLSSKNPGVRRFATLTVDDPLHRTGYSVMRAADKATKRRLINWRNKYHPLRRKVAAELNIPQTPGSNWRGQVNTLISKAVRADGPAPEGALGEAVTFVRSFINREREYGNSMGIWNLERNDQYLTRDFNSAVIRQVNLKDPEGLRRLFAGAIRSGSTADLSDAAIDELARRVIEAGSKTNYRTGRMGNTKAWLALKEQLKKDLVDDGLIDEKQFDDFMEVIAPIQNTKSIVRGGKSRLTIDENYVDPESGLQFSDFLNNDLDDLMNRSVKANRGAGYWTKMVDNLVEEVDVPQPSGKVAGVKTTGPTGYTLEEVITYLERQGPLSYTERQAIQQHYRSMLGIAQITGGEGAQALNATMRAGQDIAFVTNMADAGFTNSVELANAVATNGFIAIEAFMGGVIPSLRRAVEARLTGAARFDDATMDMLEELTTVGTLQYRGVVRNRMEDGMDFAGDAQAQSTSQALQRTLTEGRGVRESLDPTNPMTASRLRNAYTQAMGALRSATYNWPTGIGPIDSLTRRAAGLSSLQRFISVMFKIDKAGGIGVFKEGHLNHAVSRLKDLGLADDDITKIIAKLKEPGVLITKRNYRFKKKYLVANPEKWELSPELELFALAIQRECDRLVQRPSVSSVPWIMNNPVGHTIMQFRTFGLSALAQQVKYGIRRHDRIVLNQFVGLAMATTLLVYAKAIKKTLGWGEDERKEYLDHALAPENLAARVAQQHAFTQMFTPFIDPVGEMIFDNYPEEGLFGSGHRYSSVGGAVLDTIPIVDTFNTGIDLFDEWVMDPLRGDYKGVTQRDLKKLKRMGPLNTAFPLDNIANISIQNSGLPARD